MSDSLCPKEVGTVTNADRIRGMTDEQLAKFITELVYPASYNYYNSFDIWVEGLRDGTLKWLKSEVETK